MPTLRERWNNLQTVTQIVIFISLLLLILLTPINTLLFPVNVLGMVFTYICAGIVWVIVALLNIIALSLAYLVLAIGHLAVNGVLWLGNAIIELLNKIPSVSLSTMPYQNIMTTLPVWLLVDPDTLIASFVWPWLNVSSSSLLEHLTGWTFPI